MKTTIINEIIFVFGNPFQKVRELAEQYNITVVGTNDPEMLIEQLKCSNDCNPSSGLISFTLFSCSPRVVNLFLSDRDLILSISF